MQLTTYINLGFFLSHLGGGAIRERELFELSKENLVTIIFSLDPVFDRSCNKQTTDHKPWCASPSWRPSSADCFLCLCASPRPSIPKLRMGFTPAKAVVLQAPAVRAGTRRQVLFSQVIFLSHLTYLPDLGSER